MDLNAQSASLNIHPPTDAASTTKHGPSIMPSFENAGSIFPLQSARSLKRMPSMQRIDTSTQNGLTMTPASAHSTSSITNSPSWSFQGSPYSSLATHQTSLTAVDTLSLPDPLISSSVPTSISSSFSRQNGLTRKLSSGKRALSRLGRTASSGTASRRDHSSGPVARRRSDSKASIAAAFETDEPVPEIPLALGCFSSLAFPEDNGSISDFHARSEPRADIVAPAVSQALIAGCTLVKIAGRRTQEKTFYLDNEGSCVSWMGRLKRKHFYLDNIKSIRHGKDAVSSQSDATGDDVDEERCFTISYAPSASSKGSKTLQLQAPTKHLCQLWVKTLEALAKHREELMSEMTGPERQSVLRTHWDTELSKQNRPKSPEEPGALDLNAVARICRRLHIHCPRKIIEGEFHTADREGLGLLSFEQFRAFVRRLRARVDIKPLFNQLKTPGVEGISKDDFLRFLKHDQGIITEPHHLYWMERFEALASRSSPDLRSFAGGPYMDFAAFSSFMTSKDCHVYATGEKVRAVHDRPLNEYFISSSHNTYLTGRQVNGTSSVEAYVTALRRGCRSVEIDCWNGENNNPRVTHGFTGTTSVSFVDVVRAINRCAFETSPYPVILSLEVHCNPLQQMRMVEIMIDNIDQGRLLLLPLPEHATSLPSPDELKFKILIKVKATNAQAIVHSLSEGIMATRKRSTSPHVRRPAPYHPTPGQVVNPITSPSAATPPESVASPTDHSMTPSSEDEYESDMNGVGRTMTDTVPARKTSKIIKELAALGVYMQGYSFRTVADLSFQQFNHIFSINENAAITVSKQPESKIPFEQHNTSFMCRVYPKGTRINSSNFDPNTFWRRGVQMVALNWQTYDIHMQMNQAMFGAGSDRTGYVLKPHYLRNPHRFDDAPEQRPKLRHQRINFAVKVISAQQLPLLSTMGKNDLISPFVEVQMFSAEDKARGIAYGQGGEEVSRTNSYHGIGSPFSRRTKTVPENGFNPQFNDVIELSLETKYPELVFVRFVVYQSHKTSHKELAVFTAKLDRLQQGYRHLPLYNNNGEELIFSTLFCRISKEQPRESIRETAPARQSSIRKLLSRSNTSERGRTGGQTFADSERLAAQKRLNLEIEAKRR